MTPRCTPCAAAAPKRWQGSSLHQMHALSLTETEIETLLRETAQQQTRGVNHGCYL